MAATRGVTRSDSVRSVALSEGAFQQRRRRPTIRGTHSERAASTGDSVTSLEQRQLEVERFKRWWLEVVELRRRARKQHIQPDDGMTLAERIRTKRERLLQDPLAQVVNADDYTNDQINWETLERQIYDEDFQRRYADYFTYIKDKYGRLTPSRTRSQEAFSRLPPINSQASNGSSKYPPGEPHLAFEDVSDEEAFSEHERLLLRRRLIKQGFQRRNPKLNTEIICRYDRNENDEERAFSRLSQETALTRVTYVRLPSAIHKEPGSLPEIHQQIMETEVERRTQSLEGVVNNSHSSSRRESRVEIQKREVIKQEVEKKHEINEQIILQELRKRLTSAKQVEKKAYETEKEKIVNKPEDKTKGVIVDYKPQGERSRAHLVEKQNIVQVDEVINNQLAKELIKDSYVENDRKNSNKVQQQQKLKEVTLVDQQETPSAKENVETVEIAKAKEVKKNEIATDKKIAKQVDIAENKKSKVEEVKEINVDQTRDTLKAIKENAAQTKRAEIYKQIKEETEDKDIDESKVKVEETSDDNPNKEENKTIEIQTDNERKIEKTNNAVDEEIKKVEEGAKKTESAAKVKKSKEKILKEKKTKQEEVSKEMKAVEKKTLINSENSEIEKDVLANDEVDSSNEKKKEKVIDKQKSVKTDSKTDDIKNAMKDVDKLEKVIDNAEIKVNQSIAKSKQSEKSFSRIEEKENKDKVVESKTLFEAENKVENIRKTKETKLSTDSKADEIVSNLSGTSKNNDLTINEASEKTYFEDSTERVESLSATRECTEKVKNSSENSGNTNETYKSDKRTEDITISENKTDISFNANFKKIKDFEDKKEPLFTSKETKVEDLKSNSETKEESTTEKCSKEEKKEEEAEKKETIKGKREFRKKQAIEEDENSKKLIAKLEKRLNKNMNSLTVSASGTDDKDDEDDLNDDAIDDLLNGDFGKQMEKFLLTT